MIAKEVLWDEAGVLWLGREGQDAYGRKNFLDLISVFTAPPLFTVLHGRRELGFVDESTFLQARRRAAGAAPGGPGLAGDATWTGSGGGRTSSRPRTWAARAGGARGSSSARELCGAIRRILAGDEVSPRWSARAVRAHGGRPRRVPLADRGRRECPRRPRTATPPGGPSAAAGPTPRWPTSWPGGPDARVTSDNFAVRFPPRSSTRGSSSSRSASLADAVPGRIVPQASEQALDGLKFSECLPPELATRVVQARLSDARGVAEVLERPTRIVYES